MVVNADFDGVVVSGVVAQNVTPSSLEFWVEEGGIGRTGEHVGAWRLGVFRVYHLRLGGRH